MPPPEQALIPHAVKILHAYRRAAELVAEMKARGELEDVGVTCLVDGDDDEKGATSIHTLGVIDWQQIAADAWAGESWKDAAVEYQVNRRNAYAWVRQ